MIDRVRSSDGFEPTEDRNDCKSTFADDKTVLDVMPWVMRLYAHQISLMSGLHSLSHVIQHLDTNLTKIHHWSNNKTLPFPAGALHDALRGLTQADEAFGKMQETLDLLRRKERTNHDVAFLLRESLQSLGDSFERNGIQVETRIDEGLVVDADEGGALICTFLCVINNSIEALSSVCPGRPKVVRIGAKLCRDTIEVRIEDTGVGIPDRFLPEVIRPGFSTKPDSPGLGLTIANRSVSGVGGSLTLASSEDSGTVVTMLFPAKEQ
jgi:signal transduction histidine kinase